MAENELPAAAAPLLPELDEIGSALAPIIYAEMTTTFGFRDGVGNFTLEAVRHVCAADGAISNVRTVVGHVRMPLRGIVGLKQALEGVLLQATPPASETAN